MGVKIDEIRFYNLYDNSTYTDYLLGNVGDKVQVQVQFTVEAAFVSNAEVDVDRIMINVSPYRVNQTNTQDIVYVEQEGALEDFRVGDTIAIYNADQKITLNYEIYQKIDSQTIRVQSIGGGAVDFSTGNPIDTTFPNNTTPNEQPANSYISITTPITSIKYKWNMIGNSESDTFDNKIDDAVNQSRVGGINNGSPLTEMNPDLPVTNDYGDIFIQGLGVGTNGIGHKFGVTHNTIIQPFFLGGSTNQLDLEDRIKPSYFESSECLKYILSIEAGRHENDPNYIQTVDFSAEDGNTGWFEENFNGLANKFSIQDVRFKRLDNSTIDAIELTDNTQTVEIDVYSTDGVFSDLNTEFALNFCVLPEEKDDHKNNGKNIIQNFRFDYAQTTVGLPTFVSGDNFTTDEQVFSKVSAVLDGTTPANLMTITATIDFEADLVADLTTLEWDYLLWVAIADHAKSVESSDRVALIADIQPFYIDLSDDGMVDITHNFLRHYETDSETQGTETPIVRTEDDVLVHQQITLDKTLRLDDDISILSFKSEIVLIDSDGVESTLEEFEQSFTGTFVVGDSQYIDTTVDRVFKMPTNEQRKQIKVKRRTDLDSGDTRVYEFYYPFLFRWEYWLAKGGISTTVFDANEPNNGLNEDWQRMDVVTDHEIYFRTEVTASKNGNLQRYQKDTLLTTYDYLEDEEWVDEKIELFDANTDAPLNGLIVNPTKVVISKTYAGTEPPALGDVEWVTRIEIHEQGGINDVRFLSSVYDWTEFSWLKSVDASNKIVKGVNGLVYTATFLINHDTLPSASSLKISGRIYNENFLSVDTCFLTTENEDPIITENSDNLTPESCEDETPITGKQMESGEIKITESSDIKQLE